MKKLIISSDALKPALKRLGLAINNKHILPALKNLYCVVSPKNLQLTASDLELTIVVDLEVDTEPKTEFEFLLPYDFIHGVIQTIGSVPVTIEYHNEKKVTIAGENDVYELNSLENITGYPNIPTLPKKNSISLGEDFIPLLHKAMLTVSKDDSRPVMMYACLDIKKKQSFLVSTDTFCMFRHKAAIDHPEPVELLLSQKMAKAMDGFAAADISWTENHVGIKSGKTAIISKRPEGKFPNYNAVIPDYGHNLIVGRSALISALHKSLVVNDGAKRTTLQLNKEPGKILFDAIDSDLERKANVQIDSEYTGELEGITINSNKLLTVLSQVESEKVRLHIGGKTKAILVSTEEDENYLGLVMPIVD